MFETLLRGENNIQGLRNADLRRRLPLNRSGRSPACWTESREVDGGAAGVNAGQVSRLLKRLRVHGLIKRIGRTYKYYLTALGRRALLAGLQVRQALLPRVLTANS